MIFNEKHVNDKICQIAIRRSAVPLQERVLPQERSKGNNGNKGIRNIRVVVVIKEIRVIMVIKEIRVIIVIKEIKTINEILELFARS